MFKKVISIFLLSLLIIGCSTSNPENSQSENKLKIVTTIAPYHSLVSQLTTPFAEVYNLVPSGSSVHNWEPTPQDIKHLNQADLIIANGLELEHFLEDLVIDSALQSKIIYVAETLPKTDLLANEEKHEHEHNSEFDPHVWLSPKITINITDKLYKNIEPLLKTTYDQEQLNNNLISLKGSLTTLDLETSQLFENTSLKNFLTFHNAHNYFFTNYNLKDYHQGSIEEFPGQEPTPQELAKLVKEIQTKKIEIIFTEPQFSPKLANTLSNDYNLTISSLDPLGLTTENYQTTIKNITNSLIQASKNANGQN